MSKYSDYFFFSLHHLQANVEKCISLSTGDDKLKAPISESLNIEDKQKKLHSASDTRSAFWEKTFLSCIMQHL